MAKLPDATALGDLGSAQSGRPIATIDTTGYARGAAAIAQGAKDLGTGLTRAGNYVNDVSVAEQKERDQLEVAKAESQYLVNTKQLQDGLAGETDSNGLKEKYDPLFAGARDDAAALISNPRMRELWALKRTPDVAANSIATENRVYSITKDNEIAGANDRLEQIRQSALTTTDEAKRAEFIKAGQSLIEGLQSNGYIDATKAQAVRQKWTEDYATAAISILPPEERANLLRPKTTGEQVVDRIVGVESGGKATAKNSRSSALGPGQFIDATWLSLIKETKPELAAGRSDAELLDLRTDPKLSRQMVDAYAQKNAAYLQSQGIQATPGNIYLAHFLGPDSAAKVLKADPDVPVAELVGREAVRANPSILGGKTAGTVAAWAADKMGGAEMKNGAVDFIPYDKRVQLYRQAEAEVTQKQAVVSANRGEELERTILDAGIGKGELPKREAIETDPVLSETARNNLLRQYDKAAGDVAAWKDVWAKFQDPNGGAFNPYDADERKAVNTLFQTLGSSAQALQAVVDRTGILPKDAAVGIRADLVSNDPARVAASLTLASNLLGKNQNIFVGVEGKSDLENNAVAFRHYIDDLGMTAEDAAKKIVREQSPEYQAGVKAKLKTEDIDAKIRKELSINDVAGQFDNSFLGLAPNPSVGFDPATRQSMFSQYAEQVRERYMETGDWSLAKTQAADSLKKTWGISKVNGSATVMQYPPERAPAYAGIADPAAGVAKQAIDAVKAETGNAIEAKGLRLMPIPGLTGDAYKAGQPVPYNLMWTDKAGVVHMLNPGKAFIADPLEMKKAEMETHRVQLEQRRAAILPALQQQEANRQNLRNIRKAAGDRIRADRLDAETFP